MLPWSSSYLNSRLLGYVTIGYIEPSSHYLGNWSPRAWQPPTECWANSMERGAHLAPQTIKGLGLRVQGFRVQGLRGLGFGVWGLRFFA